jgi:hypothetical protein
MASLLANGVDEDPLKDGAELHLEGVDVGEVRASSSSAAMIPQDCSAEKSHSQI